VNELDARVSVIVIDSLDAVATLDETKTDVATLDEAKTDAFVHMHQVFMTTLARREGESRESCFVRLFRASRRGCRLDYTP
jgi:archaellum biogenesis ATPase FlaH